jgi:hypothetical protein
MFTRASSIMFGLLHPHGNKKLDRAYEDAQRIAAEKLRICPMFLFFSVSSIVV